MHVFNWPVPIHSKVFADALGCTYSTEIPETDWVIFPFPTPRQMPYVDECKRRGIKTAAYWIGSDAWRVVLQPNMRGQIPKFDTNMAVHPRLGEELAGIGIESHIVSPAARYLLPRELIQKRQAAVYMPTTGGVYRFEQMKDIAKKTEMPFVFFGKNGLEGLPDNATNAGRLSPQDATQVLRESSVVLRMTDHDGFPQGVIEMKMMGRNAITNYPYQGCLQAETEEEAIRHLENKVTHRPDESMWPEWYQECCAPERFAKTVRQVLSWA